MTKFTREDGTQNEALLSNEGIEKIKALGYKVEEVKEEVCLQEK